MREPTQGDGPDLLTPESGDFVQTLLAAELIDELRLPIFPVAPTAAPGRVHGAEREAGRAGRERHPVGDTHAAYHGIAALTRCTVASVMTTTRADHAIAGGVAAPAAGRAGSIAPSWMARCSRTLRVP